MRSDDAVAPTAPHDGEDSLAARTQERVIGHSRMLEEPGPILMQAHGVSAQTNAAWREVDTQWNDAIRLRPYSPKMLPASAGWRRQFRGFMVTTHPAALTGAEAKRVVTELAVRRPVSAAAPNQAFHALLLLFRPVFTQELGDLSDTPRAQRST